MLNPLEESMLIPSAMPIEGYKAKRQTQLSLVSRPITGLGVQQHHWVYASYRLGYAYSTNIIYSQIIRGVLRGGGANRAAYVYNTIHSTYHPVGEYQNVAPNTLPDWRGGVPCWTTAIVDTAVGGWATETRIAIPADTNLYATLWFGGAKTAVAQPDFTAYGQLIMGSIRVHAAWDR